MDKSWITIENTDNTRSSINDVSRKVMNQKSPKKHMINPGIFQLNLQMKETTTRYSSVDDTVLESKNPDCMPDLIEFKEA